MKLSIVVSAGWWVGMGRWHF